MVHNIVKDYSSASVCIKSAKEYILKCKML